MKTLSNHQHILLKLVGLALLAFGVVSHAQPVEAKLDPFYIVKGSSFNLSSPRILFLLDSSGSMAQTLEHYPNQNPKNKRCLWHQCEDENAGIKQSRVHAARDVIADLAQINKDKAEFALMTYGNVPPPDGAGLPVPEPCEALVDNAPLVAGEHYRFTWVETYVNNQPGDGWLSSYHTDILNSFGTIGRWALCGDNMPFPYLRHDDLGGFTMANNSNAPLPDMPLYLAESDETAFRDASNYSRQVQWFPRWIGRRGHLDCSNAYHKAIALESLGDFDGATEADKLNNVCGHDFYYWPYVDGDPGYSEYSAFNYDGFRHSEGQENGDGILWYQPGDSGDVHRLGTSRHDWDTDGALYAPFYSAATIADNSIPVSEKGPWDTADAWMMFDAITSKNYTGGTDASGGTPLRDAVGDVHDFLGVDINGNILGAKPSLKMSNAPFSHKSAASYIAFMRTVEDGAVCRPMSMIIVSDGIPDPWNSQGSFNAYKDLINFRRILGVPTYLVAFTEEVYAEASNNERINQLACAAAGADSIGDPCGGGNTFSEWDTCADPNDPADNCAWKTQDQDELKAVLTTIISKALETDVPGGTPTVANDFQLADPNDPESGQAALQTSIDGWTEVPAWIGHVARQACDDPDPDDPNILAEYCQAVIDEPLVTEETESFGPCPLGRVWDAGECLQLTNWNDRRIYTHDYNNNVFRIAEADGTPTQQFIDLVELLDSQGKIDPPLSNDAQEKSDEIVAMAEWLLGRDMPSDWKLSALPNAAPILVRRVPEYNASFLPTVGIRDPHCAGRRNAQGDNIPPSLEAFASQAWATTSGGGFGEHYDYAEAVLVGDDFGILHGFHYDSGNELFGFVPLALLNNSRQLSLGDPSSYGQDAEFQEHVFGIASTVNAGWAWDEDASTWRHLAVFGMGPGGTEIITLDVSHMGRVQTDDPVEVVWTTTTTSNAQDFSDTLGETWSRPALTYAVPNDAMNLEPKAYMVFGSGYREGAGGPERGRTVWAVDAITGETVTQRALMTVPDSDTIYDLADDYAAVSDIAVSSHCLSRYWGEMQETYWVDPAGRLYRWDLAAESSNVESFPHIADGGGEWVLNGDDFAVALESFRFPACQGVGSYSCTVNPIGGGGKGDVFTYSPAVVANNRIDSITDPGTILPMGDRDQFLIALVSGSPNDDVIDGGIADGDFHSSIYLLVDDHRPPAENAGFDIPVNAPPAAPGDYAFYMRLPLNQIERTRTIHYPNGDTELETRNFAKAARPLRPPMIRVTGLADGQTQLDAEVFYVTWTIYEPGSSSCDVRWRDPNTGEWLTDPGATYEITMRLVVGDDGTFDFTNNYILPDDFGDGFGNTGGLSSPVVRQQECEGSNCGAVLDAPKTSPCDPNVNPPSVGGAISIQTSWSELEGFTPLEVDL